MGGSLSTLGPSVASGCVEVLRGGEALPCWGRPLLWAWMQAASLRQVYDYSQDQPSFSLKKMPVACQTFGCPTTTPPCSAFHYLKQPTCTTTMRLLFTLHPADNNNYVIIQLQIELQLLLRYLTSGQFIHFTRDYISYMMSVQQNYYLPTTTLPQTIYKVNYNMTIFTDNYSLRNNYFWNYHMPLLLPELLHYLYNRDQLHDYQHKAITTILCKSIQYYGFTLLTMTNLTQHHKALLHYLKDYNQHMSCPEIDDERLRGAPNYMKTFFTTNYFATLDSRLQKVQDYRTQNWGLHLGAHALPQQVPASLLPSSALHRAGT